MATTTPTNSTTGTSLNLGATTPKPAKPAQSSSLRVQAPTLEDCLPKNVDRDQWSTFPLLEFPYSSREDVQLDTCPHLLFAGRSGTGKSTALLTVATSALARGFDLVVIDTLTQAIDLRPVTPFAHRVATTRDEAHDALGELCETIERRLETLAEAGVNRWDKAGADMVPILVVIDTLNDVLLEDGYLDEGVQYQLHKILRLGRAAGVHLAVSSNRPEATKVEDQFRVFKLGAGGTQGSAAVLTMPAGRITATLQRIGVEPVPAADAA